ncbi:hypothetical protein M3610_09180 [Neobacillus sp. MER 74]|uniref:hypothetical protein n=1 Tax=Neobacillus sp. MER 74 TaxID=2939566 RepID=UPI002040E388|nr:hypothetical protein [Neobacillus sp. MER 74]MCM3115459.1 hypothetical protein [Neobacillus sp. MER 74]
MNKSYLIYNLQLAEYLIRKGYSIIGISPNKFMEGKYVFFLSNEDGQIETHIKEYSI